MHFAFVVVAGPPTMVSTLLQEPFYILLSFAKEE
jgi:hypothetical protein